MTRVAMMTLLVLGAACGGPGTGPVPNSVAQDKCREVCEHDKTCDPTSTETVEACTADCVVDVTGAFREDAFVDIADCISSLACTADEDICATECSPTSAHNDYETACRAKAAECGGSGSAVDSLCEVTPSANGDNGFLCFIIPAAINEMAACYDKTCNEIDMCLSAVLTKYGID